MINDLEIGLKLKDGHIFLGLEKANNKDFIILKYTKANVINTISSLLL